jgi:hypothetical protein
MRWAGHVARLGEGRGVYRVLMGKTEGRRPLGRSRRRWEDNIRIDLQEVGWGVMAWIGLAQDRDRWRAIASQELKHLLFITFLKSPDLRHTLYTDITSSHVYL